MAARRVLLLAAAAVAGAGAQLQLPWTTDVGNTTFGPDGPWQAVLVKLNGTGSQMQEVPLWPGGSGVSEIPTADNGGAYNMPSSAVRTGRSRAASDKWFSTVFMESEWSGFEYWDGMELEPRFGSGTQITANATFVAATKWTGSAPLNETDYRPSVGILGFAPRSERSDDTTVPSILEQLKASGDIDRNAFSVHVGSAALGLPGSLVLGGYERNRALGQVGTFTLTDSIPIMYLRDVVLDVEVGTSTSYAEGGNGSFWQESTETGEQYTKYVGGAPGSVVVIPNPASPYIYLPPGFCEAIATSLHMTRHDATGLYLWERSTQAELFVNSSSYLGFVLSDQSATNLTIKVPFTLLNLTLEPPLAERPVSYFPCKSMESPYGFWQLGRAFLQAAFLAIDYEGEVAYMAQAPGPHLEQSVVKKLDGSAVETNPAESFAKTWQDHWQPVYMDRSSFDASDDERLSAGGKAGVAVAGVAVTALFVSGLWFWWRRKRGKGQETDAGSGSQAGSSGESFMDHGAEQKMLRVDKATELDGHTHAVELDPRTPPVEMGAPLPHEMGSHTESTRTVRHEVPSDSVVYELPTPTATPDRAAAGK
ncbi:Aspartic-type endopeptidase [Colletotrichum higginsianum IMI 349063]|uniref:Aspartic-type endopeptidase n=1 Tax=Colletotrichum higginsianum (strain IMI 349063) TaxID=759273 RepID=A0A1B7YSH1_COLHI|nr:Aspartic-type endopeptidase [Colletotrichum higginsianum IMI 349063]OBR14912.1 Aspartic-type endopeptidase [Colletotrichum higginsianum IMI 349063]